LYKLFNNYKFIILLNLPRLFGLKIISILVIELGINFPFGIFALKWATLLKLKEIGSSVDKLCIVNKYDFC